MRQANKDGGKKGLHKFVWRSGSPSQGPSQPQSTLQLPPNLTADLSRTPILGVPDGDKAAASSTPATTLPAQLPQTLSKSGGKARLVTDEIAAAENDTSVSSTNISNVLVPPSVSSADTLGVSQIGPTVQCPTSQPAGNESLKGDADQSEQTSARGVIIGTPLENSEHEVAISLISPAKNDAKVQALWNKAANDADLSQQQRETLAGIGTQAQPGEISSSLKTTINGILKEKKGKQWKIKFRGDDIVLGHVGIKILHWLDRFKEIGDTIVQFDPAHSALPWAGVRFLLKVALPSPRN